MACSLTGCQWNKMVMAIWFIWNGRLHCRKWFIRTNGISSYSEDMNKLEPKKGPRVPSFAKMKLTKEMLILAKLMERQHTEDFKSSVLSRIYKSSAVSWNSLSPLRSLTFSLKTAEANGHVHGRHEGTWIDHPFRASKSRVPAHICICQQRTTATLSDVSVTISPCAVISADFTAKQGSHLREKL